MPNDRRLTGTPLILSILSLVVSLVVGVGAVLMARANLQRQIQVAAREAWMREFREKVAVLLASARLLEREHARGGPFVRPGLGGDPEKERRLADIYATQDPAHQAIILLLAERAEGELPTEDFTEALGRLLGASGEEAAEELTSAAAVILMDERAAIEARGRWRRRLRHWKLAPLTMATLTGDEAPSPPWSRFVAWCRRPPPRFPN